MNGTFALGFLIVIVVAILVILFLVSRWNVKRCPKCGELLNVHMSSRFGDRWVCEKCGYEEKP